jgi:hypothetical protein
VVTFLVKLIEADVFDDLYKEVLNHVRKNSNLSLDILREKLNEKMDPYSYDWRCERLKHSIDYLKRMGSDPASTPMGQDAGKPAPQLNV